MQAFEVALNFTEPPGREPMRLPNEGCDQYAASYPRKLVTA
jgi:hypothetical protein